ncbi:MAG: hypothetical protein AAGI03_14035 [Pseudomonadota bacterium]
MDHDSRHASRGPMPAYPRRPRPERHTIEALMALDPGNHQITRITGVLKTLARIDRLPRDPF